jgi:hypothetical protein
MSSQETASGFGIGNIIAAVVAYNLTHSVVWTIVGCLFGWLYLIATAVLHFIS